MRLVEFHNKNLFKSSSKFQVIEILHISTSNSLPFGVFTDLLRNFYLEEMLNFLKSGNYKPEYLLAKNLKFCSY